MFKSLQEAASALVLRKKLNNNNEIITFVFLIVAALFCLLIHLYLLTIFSIFKMPIYIFLNCLSIFVYASLFFLIKSGKYKLAFVLLSYEVIFYTTISVTLSGISSFIFGYYLLVLIMQIIIPYECKFTRVSTVIFIFVCVFYCIFLDSLVVPRYPIKDQLASLFKASNILIVFVGVVIELYAEGIIRSIIDKINKAELRTLTSQANTDPLTGLYNRRYADKFFKVIKEDNISQFVVAMLDIDDFKVVNDTYGHACGDEVLKFLANFLKNRLRKSDVIFRWGGEEFLILLSDIELEKSRNILESMREELSQSIIPTANEDIKITITIGAANLELDDPFASIDLSDKRMYQGKKTGKNRVIIE